MKDQILQKIWQLELFFQSNFRVMEMLSPRNKNSCYAEYLPIAASSTEANVIIF